MAKKFHNQSFVFGGREAAAVNLRLATHQLASIGVPPRAKRVHPPRYRLPVTMVVEDARPVKIRHASQNLGTVVSETLPVQTPRV